MNLSKKIISSLENIYISPLELCNLNCQYCYTKKTKNILSNRQILSFVRRYQKYLKAIHKRDFFSTLSLITDSQEKKNYVKNYDISLKSIIFCGGEVFTLKNFPRLVNNLISKNIFITIITNGTVDRLKEIKNPKNCQLIVSFDGPQKIHDQNRGKGNFQKSYDFVKHALNSGFPVEIFYLITKDSYPYLNKLNILDLKKTYLTDRLGSLTLNQIKNIRQNYPVYPPKKFGCAMLSLQSDAKFYPCCESQKSIGSLKNPIKKILSNYLSIYLKSPICSDPDYFCELKELK
jgi:organic radical activating enzyme